jgi:hypothetical protein
MTWAEAALVALAVVIAVVASFWYWANRMDRLHRRVEAASASLNNQLTARATAALDLAHAGALDPVSSIVLAETARACLASSARPGSGVGVAWPAGFGQMHSELSQAVTVALGDPAEAERLGGPLGPLLSPLREAWYRAMLARRFYNEAVCRAQRLRGAWGVRVFRLAGHAAMPQTLELEDAWPPALGDSPA